MIRPVRSDGTIDTGGVFVPIVRRRVLDRIASAAMMRVVLLLAPAGYGKSVALRQHLDTVRDPFVRYDVLPDHVGLLGFLRGLTDTLSQVAPGARATLAGAYESNATSRSAGLDLAMWLHSHLKNYRGIIAIDDLHVVQEDRDVSQFIGSIVERTKDQIQWIFASRSYVGLPVGTWLAYGDCDLAIDDHDLQFNVDEAKEAARSFRLGVREDELEELLQLTEGWPTAMSFALRSSTRSANLRNIATLTREMIYHYLAEQVFSALSEEEREFIEVTALLPEIELDVMVAAGFDKATALLEAIRARSAFIQEERDRPGLFRLHDLFRDFLLRQLQLHGDEKVRRSRARVARALESRGRVVPALRLFAEAGDDAMVSSLLRQHGLALTTRGHVDDVEYAIRRLQPAASIPDDPDLLGLLGCARIVRGQYTEGERLVQRALHSRAGVELRTELNLRLALLRTNRGGDPEQQLLELIADPSAGAMPHLEAKALLAGYYAKQQRASETRQLIGEVQASIAQVTSDETLAKVLQRIGFALSELGDFSVAAPLLEEAAEIATRQSLWSLVRRAYGVLSTIAILGRNDQAMGLRYAQQGAAAATRAGDYFDLQLSLLQMLSIEVRRGEADRAMEIERQLGELRSNDTLNGPYIASSQAHRHAWNGRFAEAHRLFGNILNRQSQPADRALVQALYALTLALDERPRESAQACEAALDALRLARDARTTAGTLIYEMAQLFVACAEILSDRLTMAERILYRRAPFTSDGIAKCMRRVVEQSLRLARDSSYDVEVDEDFGAIRDFGLGGLGRYFRMTITRLQERRAEAPKTAELLTATEQRILRDLARGMKPKDVSIEMGRSVNTIRNHIQNAIEKLQCHSRNEAIAEARRRHLL
jgi:ATP/maltotriose-dependent transcriptional regulator MalT